MLTSLLRGGGSWNASLQIKLRPELVDERAQKWGGGGLVKMRKVGKYDIPDLKKKKLSAFSK